MKQIITLFAFLLMTVSASAQTKSTVTESGLSFSKNTFYMNGQAIDKNQLVNVLGNDLYSTYKKGKGLRTAGIVCTATGVPVLITGGILIATASSSNSAGEIFADGIIGVPVAIGGAVVAIPGIIMWCVGSSRIKGIPVQYNSKNGKTAYLAPASSGMGLALNF